MRYLITGATGFVGGHIAEACVRRGQTVRAIARPTSDVSLLEEIGATVLRGDLSDPQLVRQAVEDVDVIVHCAAKLGEWGPVEEFREVNVDCLRIFLDACKGHALTRFIHMSSLGVYTARHHFGTDETEPLPIRHRDGYSQSKVEAEQLVFRYYHDFGIPVVVLRPGFIYGPRDHAVVADLIKNLRAGRVRYPGARGQRALNTIFIRNLIDAVFLAVDREQAVGQAYNLTDGEFVSKRRFIEAVADAMDLPRPTRTPPYWLGWIVTWLWEKCARLRGARQAPQFNFTRWKFIALNLDFSIEKAKLELGYLPRVRFEDAIHETMAWYKSQAP
ncbi:MAG TPA: NAD-dependent epimerase/dehydratase family protein [Gemmataceae bacterium]|jgi:nucleoside-diphosphate-sugar epimerase|nr:NAD-dependent epimerase/dehydratase family protein [Gemmataceae bacterium]